MMDMSFQLLRLCST